MNVVCRWRKNAMGRLSVKYPQHQPCSMWLVMGGGGCGQTGLVMEVWTWQHSIFHHAEELAAPEKEEDGDGFLANKIMYRLSSQHICSEYWFANFSLEFTKAKNRVSLGFDSAIYHTPPPHIKKSKFWILNFLALIPPTLVTVNWKTKAGLWSN